MTDNFEATKLGEAKLDKEEEKKKLTLDLNDTLNFKGTTLGEKSEFEKSLENVTGTTEVTETEESTLEEKADSSETTTETVKTEEVTQVEEIKEEPKKKIEIDVLDEEPAKELSEEELIYGVALKNYSEGDIIPAYVLDVERAGIFVDIHYKCEGFVSNEELGNDAAEFKEEVNIGDKVMLMLLKLETKEGYTLLSKKRADWELDWKRAYQSYKMKEIVDVKVINAVKGGLVVFYKDLKGFMPASLVRKTKETPLTDFVGQKLPAIFIEVDKMRKKIINF